VIKFLEKLSKGTPQHWASGSFKVRDLLKRWPATRPIRLLYIELRNSLRGLPRWRALRGADARVWTSACSSAKGPKVLVASSVGAHMIANSLDSMLAVALTLRGARVHGLLCDGALPACLACEANLWPDQQHFTKHGPSRTLCGPCFRPARRMWSGFGLPIHFLSRHLADEDRAACWRIAQTVAEAEIDSYEHLGVRAGMHARSGALRYFARGTLDEEPHALSVRRRFLAAALMATSALDRLFTAEAFDACVAHHGLYVPQGLLVDLSRKHNVRMATWNVAYRAGSFIFSHDDTYHFTLMNEPVTNWESLVLDEPLQAALDDYMQSRATGSKDWVSYQDNTGFSTSEMKERYGIDLTKPTVSAFTNVLWDAQVFYPSNAFPSMLDWLFDTVRYFARRHDLQLVVRVHPAEVRNPVRSRQTVVDELARAFPQLPDNVHVIAPTAPVNSYALARHSNAAVIYGTKMGVELSYMGIPTIVAGESWARNKGVTLDADSRAAYFALLDKLPLSGGLDEETRRRAARYAFHFFFRRTIPFEFLTVRKGAWPPFRLELADLAPLRPGRSPGLDLVCDGITKGTPFIYAAETLIRQGRSSH
jgi:hypothetical protein